MIDKATFVYVGATAAPFLLSVIVGEHVIQQWTIQSPNLELVKVCFYLFTAPMSVAFGVSVGDWYRSRHQASPPPPKPGTHKRPGRFFWTNSMWSCRMPLGMFPLATKAGQMPYIPSESVSLPRATRLLTFGITEDEWRQNSASVKGGLQSMHMGWGFTSWYANTCEEAIWYMIAHSDLEVVQILNPTGRRSVRTLQANAHYLAPHISGHPLKPWVTFCPGEVDLGPIFEAAGVHVHYGFIEEVLADRWAWRSAGLHAA